MVANKFLEEVEMTDNVRKECVWMCKYFHESVRKTSERYDHIVQVLCTSCVWVCRNVTTAGNIFLAFRYYEVLRRHNYVTPTSYLELILTFKTLLGVKQSEILGLKNRYVTGLEKLEFAASQVTVMQEELTALQPELIKTSAETEKLMVKIEQDTVEVEAKKEVR
jgi:dynein heavy chain